ncbi:chaperone modulator CbpM [Flavobacterium ardleyense]|uniref:chaperone modulator CbpM n=1 Tax=Flavobacterium ardleyense TaxID=2038737 RepID=UPI00298C3116|nr:chaperone modulator CbpM [Flavobacterium ardleyense]
MTDSNLILIEQICRHYEIEPDFIVSLNSYGLIEIIELEQNKYLKLQEMTMIEKMIRMHYDLQINIEGIDAISHLLNKIENLQFELQSVQNRLRIYDAE